MRTAHRHNGFPYLLRMTIKYEDWSFTFFLIFQNNSTWGNLHSFPEFAKPVRKIQISSS